MDAQDKDFQESMITLTAYPEWDKLVKDLESLIYHTQSNALECKTWDKVNEERGFAKGLNYIVDLRNRVKFVEQVDADV